MSIWSDIYKRGAGESMRQENLALIYHEPDNGGTILEEKEYRDFKYKIVSDGKCPSIILQAPNNISCFSGSDRVIFSFDDNKEKEYIVERNVNFGVTKFGYTFNQEEDYVYGEHDGHQYTIPEMEKYAEKFIDKIIQCEDRFVSQMDKS